MKTAFRKRARAFTLIELTMAMGLGLMIAAMVLALFNQQLAFLRIYSTQNFIAEEAPVIYSHVSKLIGKSERFRLHDNLDDALAGRNPRLTPSPVLVLNFRRPEGGPMLASILSFEDRGNGNGLYYYVQSANNQWSDPEWSITRKPQDVTFSVEEGILRMTLAGTNGERIVYSGSMQQ